MEEKRIAWGLNNDASFWIEIGDDPDSNYDFRLEFDPDTALDLLEELNRPTGRLIDVGNIAIALTATDDLIRIEFVEGSISRARGFLSTVQAAGMIATISGN